mmetsp:Transcript_16747/g.24529  ORF Transcript_16747/g.24529 Transcript_16747/m.24529 type:complete len:119 (+) Transcript_16747:1-357(+)
MLWVCERKPRFMEVLFQMSRNERIGFPLMLIGINTTLVCIKALKARKLFDVCNYCESVVEGLNELYFGLLRHFRTIWEQRRLTVMDFQSVLEELTDISVKRPMYVVRSAFVEDEESEL